MKDKTGRELSKGQVVDVMADGMLSAVVTDIREGGLIGANGRPEVGLLVIQVGIPLYIEPGTDAPVYITRDIEQLKQEAEEVKDGKSPAKKKLRLM